MEIDGPVMLTALGRYVNPLYPWDWEPSIVEISWHLSLINRFTGATGLRGEPIAYSVAEHSVRVADLLPEELQLAGLLHDAAEAYVGDWPTYLKHHPLIGQGFRSVEFALQKRIGDFYGADLDHDLVHWADRRMLATERRDLMPDTDEEWLILRGVKPLKDRVVPWPARVAKARFMARFEMLAGLKAAA